MNYYLKIGDTEFPHVSKLEIAGKYRKETRQTNIAGGYLIDRVGTEKISISATLNQLTPELLKKLRQARFAITTTVVFDRGNTRTTKTMVLNEFTEPSPIYFFNDKSNGMIFGNVEISLEEM